MKKILSLTIFSLALAGASFAQEKKGEISHAKPTDADKTASFDAGGKIKRGAMLGSAKKISLAKALKKPEKYTGKAVRVEGVIVRSCKMEG